MEDFLAWHEGRVYRRTGRAPAASTLRSVRHRLNSAMRAAGTGELSVLSTVCLDELSAEDLLDRLAVTNSPGSLRLVYEALRALEPYARAKGWADGPFVMSKPGKNPRKPITVYEAGEVERLVMAARGKSLRWWTFLATLSHTGRRVGELLTLRWEYLHLEPADALPPHFELPTTKTKRQAYVPLDVFLRSEVLTPANVAALRAEPQRRFTKPVAEYPFPWSYNCAEKMFRRHCELVGVTHRGFHCFRHTKATEMLARGVPIQAVSALLGHANVATTDRIYNHATALNFANYLEVA